MWNACASAVKVVRASAPAVAGAGARGRHWMATVEKLPEYALYSTSTVVERAINAYIRDILLYLLLLKYKNTSRKNIKIK